MNKAEGTRFPEYRLYHKAILIFKKKYNLGKKIYGSMEQNIEPRNKHIYMWSVNLQQMRPKYTIGKRQASSVSGVRKIGQLHPRV